MLKAPTEFIILFIVISVLLILAMAVFIAAIVYRYQQKQNVYFKDIETLKTSNENALLQSQLEIKEQTIQSISREIHDNIGHKLTLVKLYLNTLDLNDADKTTEQVNHSVNLIGEVIKHLRNLSQSMNSDIILNNGFIEAIEHEQNQLKKTGLFKTDFSASGSPKYLSKSSELVLFRIVQEALNNIVKHAGASAIKIHLHYGDNFLSIKITDNGTGFNVHEKYEGTGLLNIKKRTGQLNGEAKISSSRDTGTLIKIKIPLDENNE